MGDIYHELFGQVLRQSAGFDLEQHVFQHAAISLHTLGFADGFDWHHDGDLLVLGDFVKIHMQHFPAQGMMLDFLHERQPLGPRVFFDREVNQEVFRGGVMDQIPELLRADLDVLRLGLASINHCRDAPGLTEFLGSGASAERAGDCVQGY